MTVSLQFCHDKDSRSISRVKFWTRRMLAGVSLALVMSSSSVLAQETVKASAIINLDKPGTKIDRNIYGQFAEHLGRGIYEGIWVGPQSRIPNIKGYRKDVLGALRAIHVPVVRWPGGCFSEVYDWRDGIGPRSKRPVRTRMNWDDVTDSNRFGTHEFLDFMELLGADAYVSGNVGSMSPRDMQLWLEYMTADNDSTLAKERRKNGRDKPWTVKYFGIGNETWGCGGNMLPAYAADVNARYSAFVKAPKSMGMIRVASGASVQGGGDYEAFTEAMMKHPGETEALSFHYYAMPMGRPKSEATGFSEAEWADVLDLARKMDPMLTQVEAIMDKYDAERKIALFVDEWGAWYKLDRNAGPGEHHFQKNTMRDAMVAALTLDIFHRHTDRVKMANIAQMVNVLQAMILTQGNKMILTPTYHVFDLYQPFMDATPYPAFVATPDYVNGAIRMPMIDMSAARGKDGALYVAIVNTDPKRAAQVESNLTGTASGRILTAPSMDAGNDVTKPDYVRPAPFGGKLENGRLIFEMPAKSIAVVKVQ